MQTDQIHQQTVSSFGGSTPSLYSLKSITSGCAIGYDTVDYKKPESKRFSDPSSNLIACEKPFSRNYFDVERVDFTKPHFMTGGANGNGQLEQLSRSQPQFDCSSGSSATNSLSSSEELSTPPLASPQSPNIAGATDSKHLRCKTSVENLSEDSGYSGDTYTQLRQRSRSIPNFSQDHCLIEEEEFEQIKSLEHMATHCSGVGGSDEDVGGRRMGGVKIIMAKQRSSKIDDEYVYDDDDRVTIAKHQFGSSEQRRKTERKKATDGAAAALVTQQPPFSLSASLPDILEHVSDRSGRQTVYEYSPRSRSHRRDLHFDEDFSIVSSVPSSLNICQSPRLDNNSSSSWNASSSSLGNHNEFGGGVRNVVFGVAASSKNSSRRGTAVGCASSSVASKNFDLCDFETSKVLFGGGIDSGNVSGRQLKVINASYSNLTVLDYSGRRGATNTNFRAMAEQRKKSSDEICHGNFLLDEISAHFDRNLSILNDRKENYDPEDRLIHQLTHLAEHPKEPPIPPPRRFHNTDTASVVSIASTSSPIHDLEPATYNYTFDRDPTNLITAYAASLERCNFDLNTSASNIDQVLPQLDSSRPTSSASGHHAVPMKRELVSSTPNLFQYQTETVRHPNEDYLRTSSTHTSMNLIPTTDAAGVPVTQGILSNGSRQSLGKGVSFCPIVSEISWKEQSSDELADEGDYANDDEDDEDGEYR